MKIEIDDNTGITICLCVIVLMIASCAMFGCKQVELTKRAAFVNGLEQVQLEGSTQTRFGKP